MKLIKMQKPEGAKNIGFAVRGEAGHNRYNLLDRTIEDLLPKIGAEAMRMVANCPMGVDWWKKEGPIDDNSTYSINKFDRTKLTDYLSGCEVVQKYN